MARTHVIIPDDILEEIDRLVGPRKRSEFLTELAMDEIKRRKRIAAAEAVAGSLKDVEGRRHSRMGDSRVDDSVGSQAATVA